MKLFVAASILAILIPTAIAAAEAPDLQLAAAVPVGQSEQAISAPRPLRVAYVCFYSSEETSGMNKICYYNCLQSLAAITLGFTAICPMSINR